MIELRPFKAEVYFTDAESQVELLLDAWQSGDQKYLELAFETVAKAKANEGAGGIEGWTD